MNTEQMNYFEARGVESSFYADYRLPYYYKDIISTLKPHSRILDFGCGFGQNLYAIKHNLFAWKTDKHLMGGGAAHKKTDK